ncbi:peptidase family M48-domain-containing protein [Chytridium lagenaria]|nr:peptidase family M48-domain-containing protein [Chytridium lagenaria]
MSISKTVEFVFFNGRGVLTWSGVGEPFYKTRKFWMYAGVGSGVFGVYYAWHLETVPISGRRRFIDLTKQEEQILGKQAYAEIMAQFGHKIVSPMHPYSIMVRRVCDRIIKVSGMPELDWEVHLIDDPQRNAFVIPGGKVFVFTGILPVVQNEDGLAAVLGHEVAHQLARHSAEKMSWVKIVMLGQILLSFFFDTSFIFNRLFLELGVVVNAILRKCESEADYIGLLQPRAAAEMWKRMKEFDHGHASMEYMSTHPSHDSRIAKIGEWLPEAMELYQNNPDCQMASSFLGLFNRTPWR